MLYECWSILSFHVCCGVLPSQHEKGSKIIQIAVSLLMRSSTKHVLVFPSLCAVVICRTGIEDEYLIFKKGFERLLQLLPCSS